MQRQNNGWVILLVFFLISGILFFFSSRNILNGFDLFGSIVFPLEKGIFALVELPKHITTSPSMQKAQDAALHVVGKYVDYEKLKDDNTALRDQFATSQTQSFVLLPAHIIGAPQFLPGVGYPDTIIIDQGYTNGVKKGQAVVYKNSIVGNVVQVRSVASQVKLVSSPGISFTAKTATTNAAGVLRGMGNQQMILDNVVLSDTLQVGDLVVTSLTQNIDGTGYPTGFVIGKITSLEKNPSNLFQRASVQSLVDVTKIPMVFVIKGVK